MLGVQLLILGIILIIIPILVGTLFTREKQNGQKWIFCWISGQMTLWAGFLVICVPMILLRKSFVLVTNIFFGYTMVLLLIAVLIGLRRYKRGGYRRDIVAVNGKIPISKCQVLMWGIFVCLLLMQLVLTIILAYEEGDDAFYLATATITEKSNTMYLVLPYYGVSTGLDARHGLAPFPIWIAYLARLSGIETISVAQVFLPLSLIGMAYGIYYLVAEHLCKDNRGNIPFFMILIGLLNIFGGYSVYSAENFLLVRASQGKAVIAAIIIPFLLYLFMLLVEHLQNATPCSLHFWILMIMTTMAGCLCSTLGTILTCMLIGVTGLCTAVSYRNWKVLIPMVFSCVVPVGMALLYFVVQ
ncbi:MAG: hypothetical protein IKK33_09835 [Lachnospiraceae bacterium]|nr:hypothetical protein [Lachnospiraceae bacterium]